MPANKNKLLRIQTIDECLQNRFHTWTIAELQEACGEKVREFREYRIGDKARRDADPGERTIRQDIAEMRRGLYGPEAPIELNRDTGGYYYSDPYFSLNANPVKPGDVPVLEEALQSMKDHLKPSELYDQFFEFVTRVKGKMKVEDGPGAIIQYDHAPSSTGLQWLEPIIDAIRNRKVLEIDYQPFGKDKHMTRIHPYLLKEYNNRWYVVGYDEQINKCSNRPLDRIQSMKEYPHIFFKENNYIDTDKFFRNMIGVTWPDGAKVEEVQFRAKHKQAKYLQTKPVHHTLRVINTTANYVLFQMEVVPNYELEQTLLRMGEEITVVQPKPLATRIKERVTAMKKNYR